jgi:hypothetical protein
LFGEARGKRRGDRHSGHLWNTRWDFTETDMDVANPSDLASAAESPDAK